MKSFWTSFLLVCVSLGALTKSFGGNEYVVAAFQQANALYNEAMTLGGVEDGQRVTLKLEEAARLYEGILSSGFVSWPILYNLGNVEYRRGRIGKAILNYRRAERLAPRNADIKANLRQAKQQLKDREAVSEMPSFLRSLLFPYYGLNLNEVTVLAAVLYFVFSVLEIFCIFSKSVRLRRATALFLFLTAIAATSLFVKVRNEQHTRTGVVVAQECSVRSGPGEEYPVSFKAHEGAEVIVMGERADAHSPKVWLRVKVLIEAEERTETETRRVFGPEGYVQSGDVELL